MDTNADLRDLIEGNKKFHEIGGEDAQHVRRAALEQLKGIDLAPLRAEFSDEQTKANIENLIGAARLPIGVCGPVEIEGEYAQGAFHVPLATTEGALVASVNRGMRAISQAGGCTVRILKDEQTRSILFLTDSVRTSLELAEWVDASFSELKKVAEKDEPYLTLLGIQHYIIGRNVWLRLKANTHDAMGMNMLTLAGKRLGTHIEKKRSAAFIAESGNMCVDKKPSALNLIEGRGKKVVAEIVLPQQLLKEHLKTTAEELVDMNYRKNMLGSAASASLGFNAHFANMIAALFIATGQDAAHVVDGSLGFTTVEPHEGGVYCAVTLSDLQVGTVGGGTGLPTQRACLELLGCAGPGQPAGTHAKKLAEIAAAAVLAGEISLLAALTTKDLGRAHKELNR